VAAALVDACNAYDPTVTCFERPPATLNPPALVVSRPTVVRYSAFAFGVDEVELPVICVGALAGGEDPVTELTAIVRAAVAAQPTLAGTVKGATADEERNWRAVTIGGVECLAVDVILSIHA
jgi:hypothetical protein